MNERYILEYCVEELNRLKAIYQREIEMESFFVAEQTSKEYQKFYSLLEKRITNVYEILLATLKYL